MTKNKTKSFTFFMSPALRDRLHELPKSTNISEYLRHALYDLLEDHNLSLDSTGDSHVCDSDAPSS